MEDPDAAGREAVLQWLSDQVNTDLSQAPEHLWHYTDAFGLRGIMHDEKLWATNVRFLNDSQEVRHGVNLALKELSQLARSRAKPETKRFLTGLSDPQLAIIPKFLEKSLDAFVLCFCENGDLLSQWRVYAGSDTAGGYAIGFRPPGPLPTWAQSAPGGHGLSLRRVSYDPVEQESAMHELLSGLVSILDLNPKDVDYQNTFARHLVNGIVEAATYMKHPAFKEEREWRVVYVRSNDPSTPLELKHRPSRGLLVPFVELELPAAVGATPNRMPITTINCGPGPDPDLKQEGARSLVMSLDTYADVVVEGSSAPLRL